MWVRPKAGLAGEIIEVVVLLPNGHGTVAHVDIHHQLGTGL